MTFIQYFIKIENFVKSYSLSSLTSKTDLTADSFIYMKRTDSGLPLRLKSSRTIGCTCIWNSLKFDVIISIIIDLNIVY